MEPVEPMAWLNPRNLSGTCGTSGVLNPKNLCGTCGRGYKVDSTTNLPKFLMWEPSQGTLDKDVLGSVGCY